MKNIACCLLLFACGGTSSLNGEDATSSSSAALSADTANYTAALASIAVEPLAMPANTATAEAAATQAATGTSLLTPAGCATSVSSVNVTTYTFTNCTGPYGLVNLDGQLTAKFTTVVGGALKIELTSTGLKVGGVALEVQANATITGSSTRRTLVITSATVATGEKIAATQTGDYTATWDGTCLTLSGNYMTTIEKRVWTTQVTNYERCGKMCPKAGGKVVLSGALGRSISISYDGTAEATISVSVGTNGTVKLVCGE